jgi:FtsH-binding integral membrane protein
MTRSGSNPSAWSVSKAKAISAKALIGALTLYLDFINLFLVMLRSTRD